MNLHFHGARRRFITYLGAVGRDFHNNDLRPPCIGIGMVHWLRIPMHDKVTCQLISHQKTELMKMLIEFLVNAGILLNSLVLLELVSMETSHRLRTNLLVLFGAFLMIQFCHLMGFNGYILENRYPVMVWIATGLILASSSYSFAKVWLGNPKMSLFTICILFLPVLTYLAFWILPSNAVNSTLGINVGQNHIHQFMVMAGFPYTLAAIARYVECNNRMNGDTRFLSIMDVRWFLSLMGLTLSLLAFNLIFGVQELENSGSGNASIDFIQHLLFFLFMAHSLSWIRKKAGLVHGMENGPQDSISVVPGIPGSDVGEMERKLEQVMTQQRPYLDENLNLYKLAELVGVADKKLSLLLNHHMKTNFYDYINGFRVELVKQRLSDPSANIFTIMAIANDCGFKSKSSFNRTFKRLTGISPSEFRQSRLAKDPMVFLLFFSIIH